MLPLLPLKVHEELLWLSIADIRLLEDTEYVEGFQDMAASISFLYAVRKFKSHWLEINQWHGCEHRRHFGGA